MAEKIKDIVFDGKNLSFPIDDIMVVNGKLPSKLEIKGSYLIDERSLAKLVVAFGEGVALREDIIRYTYSVSVIRKIYSNGEVIKQIADDNKRIVDDNKSLFEEVKRLREEININVENVNTLAERIRNHNNSNWINRTRKIKED